MKTLAIVCAVLMSCVACKYIDNKDLPLPYTISTSTAETQSTAPNSTLLDDKFYVSVEVVFHANQAAKYPITSDALQNALTSWAKVLPVRLTLYVEDPVSPISHLSFVPQSFLGRSNIVEILLDDLQSPPYNMDENILGIWLHEQNRILLDADSLEVNPTMAYSVALHELGHMFGVPHVVSWSTPAPSGWLVVPDTQDAESYVMYPSRIDGKSQDHLSQVEIDIARYYVLHVLASPNAAHMIQECNLSND